jgi:hypothetical protein
MITVVVTLYQGEDVPAHSKGIFDETWVDKLYRGIKRNTKTPFRFVCLVDRDDYVFEEPIDAIPLENPFRNMFCLLECLRPDIDDNQKLFMGLDTVITSDITDIMEYTPEFAMIRDPYFPETRASGVMSFKPNPAAQIYQSFKEDAQKSDYRLCGEVSDMIWLDKHLGAVPLLQDVFPNKILSYKVEIRDGSNTVEESSIVYFHGVPKPHEIQDQEWIRTHWI